MVFGMSLETYTLIHVAISLIGIATGVIVLFAMLRAKHPGGLTAIFLATTVLTSLTGFGFPFTHVTPAIILGVLSLAVLAIAIFALYGQHLERGWRTAYVVSAGIALYFNCFVLVAQSFQKIPALHALAPTGKEAPFGIAELLLMVLFAALITRGVKRFHPEAQKQQAHAA